MAIAATTVWEARTTGLSTNGGGFDPVLGASATDYSQQDSPQLALVDIAIADGTTTTITSATGGFTSSMIGNVIYLTGGSGGTLATQRRQITAVTDTNTATVDQAPAPSSAMTGVTGNLGGAVSAPWDVYSSTAGSNDFVLGNTLYIKSGTYTRTSAWTGKNVASAATLANQVHIVGYDTSRSITNKDSNRPTITTSTNSVPLFVGIGMLGLTFVKNIIFSNTASVKSTGITNSTAASKCYWINCRFTGFNYGVTGASSAAARVDGLFYDCEFDNCATAGVDSGTSTAAYTLVGCYLHDNSNDAAIMSSTARYFIFNCLIENNGRYGIYSNSTSSSILFYALSNTVAHNTESQIKIATTSNPYVEPGIEHFFYNNIIYGGQYGININGTGIYPTNILTISRNTFSNIFGGSSVANRLNVVNSNFDIDIVSDPFLNASENDYRINYSIGGGRYCQQNGNPQYCGNSLNSGFSSYPDFGSCAPLPLTIVT